MRLTSDGPRRSPFAKLTQLNLTGEAANVSTFLKHITSPLTQLDLFIDDPPALHDWQELCTLLGDQFGQTLQSLKVAASTSTRFTELVRSTSRGGDIQLSHLPLLSFSPMPRLQRLEIELPESAVFHNTDVAHLARVCPNLEVVRLCGQARFAPTFGPPFLTLEGIIPLTSGCRRLHTLSVVVNALDGQDETYKHMELSSRALVRLNVGHSWVRDPLQTALLLSHIAPNLEMLRWFAQASRSGVNDTHAAAWQKVNDFLEPLQHMRLVERSLKPKPIMREPPKTASKEVDATVQTASHAVQASPDYVNRITQAEPEMVSVQVEAVVQTVSVEIDAVPIYVEHAVEVFPEVVEESVDAIPEVADASTDVPEFEVSVAPSETSEDSATQTESFPLFPSIVPSIHDLIALPMRAVRTYTYYMALPIRFMFSSFAPSMLATASQKAPFPGSLEDDALSEKSMPSMTHAIHAPLTNGTTSTQNGKAVNGISATNAVHPVGH